jgi:peroxiredoxin
MKKVNTVAILMVLITMISCGSSPSHDVQDGNVTISGKLDNTDGKQLILTRFEGNQPVSLDTVEFTEAGEFKLAINVPQTDFFRLAVNQQNAAIFILTPGEQVTISGDANELGTDLSVSGSENTELLWMYYKQSNEFGKKEQELRNQIGALQPDQATDKQNLIDEFNELNLEFSNYTKSFIDQNSSSPAVLPALGRLNMETDFDYYEKARDGLKATFAFSTYYKDLNKNIENFKVQQSKLEMLEPGKEVPNITLNDPFGNSRSLSDLRGKVVLIDFWAAWCRPCRAENPNVVRLYNEYNKDGFDIFSVSLDKSKDKWEQAISADGLIWENHVSDLKYWQSEAAKLYNVSSIPFTVLIDKEGKVIATKLRGASLEAKLKEIFGH